MNEETTTDAASNKQQAPKLSPKGCLTFIIIFIVIIAIITMCSSEDNTNAVIEDYSTYPAIKTTVKDADKNSLAYRLANLDGIPEGALRKIEIHNNNSTDDPDDRNIMIDIYTTNSKDAMLLTTSNILKKFPKDIKLGKITIAWLAELVDQYGKKETETVLFATFYPETLEKIDWDNFNFPNIANVADKYWDHAAIR